MPASRWSVPCIALAGLLLVPHARPDEPAAAARASGRLHAIFAVDTSPEAGLAESVAKDLTNVKALLQEGFKDHKDRLVVKEFAGKDFSIRSIRGYLENLQVGPEDALLFYFSGHGGLHPEIGHILQMEQGEGDYPNLLPRLQIRRWVLDKGARLSLLITDSCNTPPDKEEVKGGRERAEWDTVRCLFLEASGVLDINAAADGEAAWCNEQSGGIFTLALVDTLRRPFKSELDRDGDGFLHWQEVLPEVQRRTLHYYVPFRTRALEELEQKIARLSDGPVRRALLHEQRQLRQQEEQTVRVWSLPPVARFGATSYDDPGQSGAVLGVVQEYTAAARAGLKPGDLVLQVGDQEVKNAEGLRDIVRRSKDEVVVRYQRFPAKSVKECRVRLAPWRSLPGID
jgi:hypothetical protein